MKFKDHKTMAKTETNTQFEQALQTLYYDILLKDDLRQKIKTEPYQVLSDYGINFDKEVKIKVYDGDTDDKVNALDESEADIVINLPNKLANLSDEQLNSATGGGVVNDALKPIVEMVKYVTELGRAVINSNGPAKILEAGGYNNKK